MRAMIVLLVLAVACGGSGAPVASQPPASAPAGAPCFADRAVLVASAVYRDLEKHALPFGNTPSAPPPERYGACTMADGRLRTADGVEIAELHCGITVKTRGLVDHLGTQVGASAEQVIAGHPRAAERIGCTDTGTGRTRCWFESVDDLSDLTHYTVEGTIGGDMTTRGAAALAFFRTRRIVEMTVRMWCH